MASVHVHAYAGDTACSLTRVGRICRRQPIPVDPKTGKPDRSRVRLPWELHRALADWNILQGHILPLLAGHAHDDPEVRLGMSGASMAGKPFRSAIAAPMVAQPQLDTGCQACQPHMRCRPAGGGVGVTEEGTRWRRAARRRCARRDMAPR